MRRSSPAIVFLILFAFLATMRPQAARAQCDSLVMTKQNSFGCMQWIVKNRNAQQATIDRIRMEIQTPGVEWQGTAIVDPWTVLLLAPNIIELDGGTHGLRAGVSMSISQICLAEICQRDMDFRVKWTTYNGGSMLCSGLVDIGCTAIDTTDSLSATLWKFDWRCHDLTLYNRNSLDLPLHEVLFDMITPGVTMNVTPPSGWSQTSGTAQRSTITTNADPVETGDSLSGFRMCFTQTPLGLDTVALRWVSRFLGVGISVDTLYIELGRQPRCDSIALHAQSANPEPACVELDVFNMHEPRSAITYVTLQLVTDGAVFESGASGPWGLAQETPKFLRFVTPTGGIQNGDSVRGFRFCVLNTSGGDDVLFRVTSGNGGGDICSVEDTLSIPAVSGLCDRFTARRTGGQDYVIGFFNRRQPALPVDGFSVAVLNSGPADRRCSPGRESTASPSASIPGSRTPSYSDSAPTSRVKRPAAIPSFSRSPRRKSAAIPSSSWKPRTRRPAPGRRAFSIRISPPRKQCASSCSR